MECGPPHLVDPPLAGLPFPLEEKDLEPELELDEEPPVLSPGVLLHIPKCPWVDLIRT